VHGIILGFRGLTSLWKSFRRLVALVYQSASEMLKACLKQKEFFYGFHLDIYKDGYTLPALAENVLFQHQLRGFEEFIEKTKTPTLGHSLPYLGDWYISERIVNYKL
jgi:hypothetical protein